MSLLDDDLIDKFDLYVLKSILIDYLKIHSWYEKIIDPGNLPVQTHYYWTKNNNGITLLKSVIQYRYKILIDEFNQTVTLKLPKDNWLTLVLDYDEEIPDFILECIKDCKLNIVRGRTYGNFGHES